MLILDLSEHTFADSWGAAALQDGHLLQNTELPSFCCKLVQLAATPVCSLSECTIEEKGLVFPYRDPSLWTSFAPSPTVSWSAYLASRLCYCYPGRKQLSTLRLRLPL